MTKWSADMEAEVVRLLGEAPWSLHLEDYNRLHTLLAAMLDRIRELEAKEAVMASPALVREVVERNVTHRERVAALESQVAGLTEQLRESNHRCGAAWRDLADAKKRIADLDKHVLMQRAARGTS